MEKPLVDDFQGVEMYTPNTTSFPSLDSLFVPGNRVDSSVVVPRINNIEGPFINFTENEIPGYFKTFDSNIPILNPSLLPAYNLTHFPLPPFGKNMLICPKVAKFINSDGSSHSNPPTQSSLIGGSVPHLC